MDQNKFKNCSQLRRDEIAGLTPRTALASCERNNNGGAASEPTRHQRDFFKSFKGINYEFYAKTKKPFLGAQENGSFYGALIGLGGVSGHKIR